MRGFSHRDTRSGSASAVFVIVVCVLGILGFFVFERGNALAKGGCRRYPPLATATALESAVLYIYTEYGRMPDFGSRVTTDSPQGVKLLTVLLGMEGKSTTKQNPRDIKFLSVKEGKNHKNGLIYNTAATSVEGLYDPWGNPYTLVLDTDYDEKLQFTVGSRTVKLDGRRVAAFSPGSDGKLGTADDVMTW